MNSVMSDDTGKSEIDCSRVEDGCDGQANDITIHC